MDSTKKTLPMRELEKISGVPRTTILYYIKEGLLPEPRKTAKNMAYYDQRFIDGLKIIRTFQEKHNLSLDEIKRIINRKSEGLGMELILDVRDRLYHQLISDENRPTISTEELAEQTGLTVEQIHRLVLQKLLFIMPGFVEESNEKQFHPDNILLGRILKKLMDAGISQEALYQVAEKVREIVEIERNAGRSGMAHLIHNQGDPTVITDTIKTGIDLFQSLISLLHLHTFYQRFQHHKWVENNYQANETIDDSAGN